jgi:hypothetical protein
MMPPFDASERRPPSTAAGAFMTGPSGRAGRRVVAFVEGQARPGTRQADLDDVAGANVAARE